jgi:hypothetical protein
VLSSFRLGPEDVKDLVGDLLAAKLQELVGREDAPREDARSDFCATLRNKAISLRRKTSRRGRGTGRAAARSVERGHAPHTRWRRAV